MPLKTSEIAGVFHDLERRFPVDSWTIDDVHVWPLIRVHLYGELFAAGRDDVFRGTGGPESARAAIRAVGKTLRGLAACIRAGVADPGHNADLGERVDSVFLTYSVHRALLDGEWYDRFCDPFVDVFRSMGKRSLVLEMSSDERYRIPRHGTSFYLQPRLYRAILEAKVLRPPSPARERLDGYAEMPGYLDRSGFGIDGPGIDWVRRRAALLFRLAKVFDDILGRIRPSLVFVAEYYSIFGMALILAARRRGICAVDIQHGMGSEEHFAYGAWNRLPKGGYELLPSVFWCWGDHDADIIAKWNGPVNTIHRTFVGGNLWMHLWMDDRSEVVRRYDRLVGGLRHGEAGTRYVLFTPSLSAQLTDWVLDAIRRSAPTCTWWIRLHPCWDRDREDTRRLLRSNGITNAELDMATDLPLQALLRHADVNVTAFSSTVVEAEDFGIRSVLTDGSGLTMFARQIASGFAVPALSAAELLEAIERQAAMKAGRESSSAPIDNGEIVRRFLATFP